MKFCLTIKLLSDTCTGSGETSAGIIDTEAAVDSWGIPVIQGRRVKGIFLENATELQEFGMADPEIVKEIFGKAGRSQEGAVFYTLYPEGADELKCFLKAAQADPDWKEYAKKDRVTGYYTSIRSQTALKNGVAEENSLRTIRVIKKNTVFKGEIFLQGENLEEKKELLYDCAKMIRHIGLNRTRGMGHVICTLEEIHEEKTDHAYEKLNDLREAFHSEEKQELRAISGEESVLPVHIYLEQPCAIDKDYIAGNMLRGVFAAAYTRWMKKLGKDTEKLHEDTLFHRLFLGDEVKYGYCWPYKEDFVYWPTPFSFAGEKKSQGNEVYDLAGCEQEELEKAFEDKESFREGFVRLKIDQYGNWTACGMIPNRVEMYHHRRPADRSLGHAVKASRRTADASDGQLYSREALIGEQEFFGEIRGKKELLECLKELLPESSTCSLGASRTAQYGGAVISYQKQAEEPESVQPDNAVVITLLAPMAVTDEYGNPSTDITDAVKTIFADIGEISPEKCTVVSYCREEIAEGFNARWNMPVPQRNVLKQGSVIVIYGAELEEETVNKMNQRSYGLYQNEGYGRIRVNWHGEIMEGCYEEEVFEERKKMPDYEKCSPKSFVDDCLMQRLESFYKKNEGCMDGLAKLLKKVPNNHVLSGMIQICKTSENFEMLEKQLKKAYDERATDKNCKWYKSIFEELCSQDEGLSNTNNNNFYNQGKNGINNCGLYSSWTEQLLRLLDENVYKIFKKLFMQMMYEEHLKEREGGAGK